MSAPSPAAERAEQLRALHAAPELLVLVNVWDAASARVVAARPATAAIATASWAVAAVHGYADHEEIPFELVLTSLERVVAAAGDLPVTADLEAGYGDPGATVRAALEAGAVGCNLEDRCEPLGDAVARVAAAVAAGEEAGVPVVVNARTDVFLRASDPRDGLDDALARGRAYLDAGAACFFAIGLNDRDCIRTLVDELGAVSVLGSPRSPSLRELAALGVQRVSFGPGPFGAALAALGRTADALHDHAHVPADLAFRPPPPVE